MAEIEVLNSSGMTINTVVSDDIKTIDGDTYLTKEAADELYKSKSDGASDGAVIVCEYDYTPAQEQKIQFSLNEPYTVMMNGWFVVNPEPSNISESWTISIDERPMFHSDNDGNMTVSTLVKTGQVITSNATSSKNGYFMPCKPELRDWRDAGLKSDAVDIWKNAVTTDNQIVDQWLDNTSNSSWYNTHGSTYKTSVSYVNGDEAFDVDGNHLFYIQTENIRTGYKMFYNTTLESFSGDLSSLTNGTWMFYSTDIQSFSSDLSSLADGRSMFKSCTSLTSFSSNLSSLTNGGSMFYQSTLRSFSGDLSSLTNGTWMFYRTALESFSGDLSNLTNGEYMFLNTALQSFNGDLSNLTNGKSMFSDAPLTSFNGDLSNLENGAYMFNECKLDTRSVQNIASTINNLSDDTDDGLYGWGEIMIGISNSTPTEEEQIQLSRIVDKGWEVKINTSQFRRINHDILKYNTYTTYTNLAAGYPNYKDDIINGKWNHYLDNLTDGGNMFFESGLTSFNSDLSSLTNGKSMFSDCYSLTTFNGDLSNLENGEMMFFLCNSLTSFDSDLSSLENGTSMFAWTSFTSFDSDLSSLTNGSNMLQGCSKLTLFNSDLSSLTNGNSMFYNCTALTTFDANLSNLTYGDLMFSHCKLDIASVQNIASTIKTVTSGSLTLGIQSFLRGDVSLTTALNAIISKGWTLTTEYN